MPSGSTRPKALGATLTGGVAARLGHVPSATVCGARANGGGRRVNGGGSGVNGGGSGVDGRRGRVSDHRRGLGFGGDRLGFGGGWSASGVLGAASTSAASSTGGDAGDPFEVSSSETSALASSPEVSADGCSTKDDVTVTPTSSAPRRQAPKPPDFDSEALFCRLASLGRLSVTVSGGPNDPTRWRRPGGTLGRGGTAPRLTASPQPTDSRKGATCWVWHVISRPRCRSPPRFSPRLWSRSWVVILGIRSDGSC